MSPAPRDPDALLRLAEGLLRRAEPSTAGLWPRTSALLALRALETCVSRVWERQGLALGGCPMRAQLVCLRTYLGDAGLAARAGHAWSALSRACHHHPYELAPTAAELESWLPVVSELSAATRAPSGADVPRPSARAAAGAAIPSAPARSGRRRSARRPTSR